MSLTTEESETLEKMAACNYSPEKIALYLTIPEKEFMREWHNRDSEIRHHYDRGQLVADFEISRKRLENATAGNLTADQQHQKEIEKRRTEDVKKEILYCGNFENSDTLCLKNSNNSK